MASQSLPPHEIIRAVIETAESKEDHDLARAFNARDKIEPNLGWSILGQIFDFHFRAENAAAPFGPMLVMDDRRSMIPDDLSDDQLDALRSTLDGVEDPEYRARIGDICWLRRRDANAARIAVEAYVASGTRLEDPEH